MALTRNQLLHRIRDWLAGLPADDGLTAHDFAAEWKIPVQDVRDALDILREHGVVRPEDDNWLAIWMIDDATAPLPWWSWLTYPEQAAAALVVAAGGEVGRHVTIDDAAGLLPHLDRRIVARAIRGRHDQGGHHGYCVRGGGYHDATYAPTRQALTVAEHAAERGWDKAQALLSRGAS